MRPAVGLIGYGRFGRLAAHHIQEEADVLVYEPRKSARPARTGRVRRASLRKAASQPVVVLTVPISSLRSVAKEIRPHLQRGAVVVEVCSVKVQPLRWLREILPRHVAIIGTHPLFGPDSVKGSLANHHLVICPARARRVHVQVLERLARSRRLKLHRMSPAKHDRLVADTLLLSQYLGRLLVSARIQEHVWSAPSYEHLRELVRIARNDSDQLFADMWRYNQYSARIGQSLRRAHQTLMRAARTGRVDS